MPLIQSKSELVAGKILDSVVNIQSHFTVAVNQLNEITRTILDLNNDELAHFGNFLGATDMESLSELHLQQGSALNSLIAGLGGILTGAGLSSHTQTVDTRSLNDKLAAQNRKIVLIDGVFFVENIPLPEPVVEPEPIVEEVIEEPIVDPVVEPEPITEEVISEIVVDPELNA